MSTTTWHITLDRPHVVVLEHGYFSAKRRVTVNGREVVNVRPGPLRALRLWNTVAEQPFTIDGHDCAVRIDPSMRSATNSTSSWTAARRRPARPSRRCPTPASSARVRTAGCSRFWWGVPLGVLCVAIGVVGNRVRGDTLLYIAGFVGMGLCFSIARAYVDRPLQGVLRCALVVTGLVALWLLRAR